VKINARNEQRGSGRIDVNELGTSLTDMKDDPFVESPRDRELAV
jgi:hypothetical protein